ncbi:uncharacterized protein STEHIDRAFT_147699 [Stereum hirsutum FP-91666 SS1]|uniref:uncharacterized protein n=1 Tax=Stereum hirsutum (strain FP-91666) TaxID=721885 RepID=UPI00044494C6|nr:uncharacterized protein STEHIDRAFT_147699 [Stereum hirsutum FP-91666 SS1]EIM86268.1 hypothetical protein STEHIDRAFT_147699 [Stereum hirsutum FP-91666 SS1]
MHLPTYLILLALAQAYPAEAAHSNIFRRATESFHKVALKHSAGLARDLRIAFGGLLVDKRSDHRLVARSSTGQQQCVVSLQGESDGSGSGLGANATSATSGHASATASAVPSTATKTGSSATPSSTSAWKVAQNWEGDNFFSGWDFWTLADPTNGNVNYLSGSAAASGNLTGINSAGNAYMRVDTTDTVTTNRNSVRITTEFSFDQGLMIMDAVHMPTGCGTWPAFWTNGPNWPAGGEIDIVEGVNDYTNNQATIHTNPGCNLPSSSSSTLGITGTIVGGTNCAAAETGNQGCGVRAVETNSFGAAFNDAGGGVYAMKLDSSGVSVYFWTRSAIPSDITSGSPDPDSWGTPMADWPTTDCTTATYFYEQVAIFDTTLCGDWAGTGWDTTGIPGQDQSCATRTGVSTCESYVQNHGSSFDEAYWEVKSVKIYQTS